LFLPADPGALKASRAPIRIIARGGTDFRISGVHPGSYDSIALIPDDQGRRYPGRGHIDVGSQYLTGITIPVGPGIEIKGRITVLGDGAAVTLQSISVQALRAMDGSPAPVGSETPNPAARGFGRRGAVAESRPSDSPRGNSAH